MLNKEILNFRFVSRVFHKNGVDIKQFLASHFTLVDDFSDLLIIQLCNFF